MRQKPESTQAANGTVTRVRRERINSETAGQRIDNYLHRMLPGVPRGRIYRLLRRGEVRVNGGRIRAEYKLKAGDEVRIPPVRVDAPPRPADATRSATLLEHVIYEDKRLLVVNKPGGLAVHGGSGLRFGVVELLRRARPDLHDLGLVHRLDRETSGCLVLAKQRRVLRELNACFRKRRVEKHYLALAVGDWQCGEQTLRAGLEVRHRRGGERHVVVSDTGKASATRVRLARRYGVVSLLQCSPETGRTHQIRVHLAHAGQPILGDERYGNVQANTAAGRAGLKRLFLHAQSIAFADDNGNELHFTAPIAADLERFLEVGIPRLKRALRNRQTPAPKPPIVL